MHLIAPLAAGMAGAASGTAELYRRGTSTRATWYTSFEGDGATSSGADIDLDSNGRAIAYVDMLVDVVVKNSSGTSVAEFTAGAAVSGIEARSQSFTGTDYDSAASAVSNPTTVQAILDLWRTNAGNTAAAIDWKVLLDGAATTLYAALGRLTGPAFYNVKDPTYGAAGDNSTDDTAAIAAAITAAGAATYGGVVFFPPGHYRVSGTLTVPADVSLLGSGAVSTYLTMNHASHDLISIGGNGNGQFISGFTLRTVVGHTGNKISVSAGNCPLVVDRCYIGVGSNNEGDLVEIADSASIQVSFTDCVFEWATAVTIGAVKCLGAMRRGIFTRCRFIAPATCNPANGIVYGRNIDLINCVFDLDAATSGTYSCYKANSTTLDASIIGCKFDTPGGGTVTGIELGTYVAASKFFESGNTFSDDSTFTAYSYTVSAAQQGAQVRLASRDHREVVATISASPYTIPMDQYGVIALTNAVAGNVSLTANMPPVGSRTAVWVYNGNGSNRDFSGAAPLIISAAKTINSAAANAMDCVAIIDPTGANTNYVLNQWLS